MLTIPVLSQIVLNGISLGAIYVLVALGFTLIFGIMRIVNFAHGEFAMLGGFAVLYLYAKGGLPFLVALPLAALSVAALSLILEQLVYQRFYQKEMQGLLATLGLSVALTYGGVILWGTYERSLPPPFPGIYSVGPVIVAADRLVVFGVATVTLSLFYLFMRFTRIGLAMRVVAQDLETAEAQGINARATYRVSFFIATAMAALAGGLVGQLYSVSPFIGAMPLMKAFIVVILGGLGSVPGAAAGGLLLGMEESFVGTFYGASVAQFASFGAIILLLILRPSGLFGERSV
jgi:branched-chain amino acid transport system permease protein